MPSPEALTIDGARDEDLTAVRALLGSQGLPFADIAPHLPGFLVVRRESRVVAVAGVEVHGDAGLLRSVCVEEAARSLGLGGRLCDELEARAAAAGITALYLLTTTAEAFFARRGYRVIDRDGAPQAIRDTAEFRSLCPSTAVCMYKRL